MKHALIVQINDILMFQKRKEKIISNFNNNYYL